jgi:putative transposase
MVHEAARHIKDWQSAQEDLTDDEWDLIKDFFPTYSTDGSIGRPVKWDKRDIVNAILYVAATGCQWRSLPKYYPHWSTVHHYHLDWSKDGTWERVGQHIVELARQAEDRDPEPTAGVIDARTVRGAATVTSSTRGYDAGKKISGRKNFGIVDTLGLILCLSVVAASTSDNAGGIELLDKIKTRATSLTKLWTDAGFKKAFQRHAKSLHITAEVVQRTKKGEFEALPKRWIVERTWSWIMNHRRLQVDYERNPVVTEGFIWAAHSRSLLRRLTAN